VSIGLLHAYSITGRAQQSFAGVWRAGSDPYYLWVGASWNDFKNKWQQLANQNLRLVDIETYVDGGQRKFTGVWRAGSDAHYLWVDADWNHFNAKWKELASQNLRLTVIRTYEDGGQRQYLGVWRAGTDPYYLWAGVDWNNFVAKWQELSKQNLRLVDFETYSEGSQRKYIGVWRAGNDGHYLWVGANWADFTAKWQELANQNLRLTVVRTYVDGGQRKYAGVWRAGSDGYYLWAGVDFENLKAKWYELAQQNLRLVNMVAYPGCESDCSNQVVANKPYNYNITNHNVTYHWPVDQAGGDTYARLSAIDFSGGGPLTLPFNDPNVKRANGWLYSPGNWHHAVDYLIDGVQSFQVRAAAPGRVAFVGWDNWSGNTVVISHDYAGVKDAFRTIYMHMRNGPQNDCANAWSNSIPNIGPGGPLGEYTAHLNDTGCPQNPAGRNPNPTHWGTNAQAIEVKAGQVVSAGQVIGWAGDTGPGGQTAAGNPNKPNTHLHVFFARRDLSNNQWYFIDPYGIYGIPSCYPSSTTGEGGTCRRYPVAWKGGHPQYP
jgi:murein DD-endopeptidase MepM/ murein hydrolase activator NlpD